MSLRTFIADYLREARLMQLATSLDDQPWVCSVWFAADSDLNIYWFSSITRRHSKELLKNKKVAGAIALPQTPDDPPRGLQFEGTAQVLEEKKDVDGAIALYEGRIFPREKIKAFMEHRIKPHKFYKITVAKFVLFDAIHFPDNARQEYVP
jgi:uncharacterized protein YhbP (UPF0306 family)